MGGRKRDDSQSSDEETNAPEPLTLVQGGASDDRPSRREQETAPAEGPSHESVNEVHLIGRLGSAVQERSLPSGDVVLTFHVVVDRPLGIRGTGRPRKLGGGVDALACAAWSARARRTVQSIPPGTWVDLEGALRRRFRRGGTSPTSFYEVEVIRIRRLR